MRDFVCSSEQDPTGDYSFEQDPKKGICLPCGMLSRTSSHDSLSPRLPRTARAADATASVTASCIALEAPVLELSLFVLLFA